MFSISCMLMASFMFCVPVCQHPCSVLEALFLQRQIDRNPFDCGHLELLLKEYPITPWSVEYQHVSTTYLWIYISTHFNVSALSSKGYVSFSSFSCPPWPGPARRVSRRWRAWWPWAHRRSLGWHLYHRARPRWVGSLVTMDDSPKSRSTWRRVEIFFWDCREISFGV